MNTLRIVLILIVSIISSAPSFSQEAPKASKHENVSWYINLYIKFKPGRAEEGLKIIHDYFVAADKVIGRNVIGFQCKSGRWDVIAFLPIEGPGDLGWKVTPTEEKAAAAMAKISGGPEKAAEIIARFGDLIADEDRQIVMRRM